MRIELGYPDAALERQLLLGQDRRDLLATLSPTLSPQQLLLMQTMVPRVHASDALLDYVQAIVRYTRESPQFESGLSPRAAIALLRAAQAWALIHGHPGVLPEDVQAVLGAVVGHRLKPRDDACRSRRRDRRARAEGRRRPVKATIMLSRLLAALRRKTRTWARKRHGIDSDPLTLSGRRIYIVPSALGIAFALMLFAMFLGAMNYANNLALGLTFMLGALALTAMHYCHRNLAGLQMRSAASEPVFAGQTARFRIALENAAPVARHELVDRQRARHAPPGARRVRWHASCCELELPAPQRGLLTLDPSRSRRDIRSDCSARGPTCT